MGNPQPSIQRRRPSLRLPDYDYSLPGWYYVTICAHAHACLFGRVDGGRVRLGPLGVLVRSGWLDIPARHPGVQVDAFVVMPNHLHGIIVLPDVRAGVARTLGSVVRAFKARVSLAAHHGRMPAQRIWQRGYYEHVIRADEPLDHIRRYIDENPSRWTHTNGAR